MTELPRMPNNAGGSFITEVDRIVEQTERRIVQYRRHIKNLEQGGRESEGAALVLARLQHAVNRLQLYRKLFQYDRPFTRVASAGSLRLQEASGSMPPSEEMLFDGHTNVIWPQVELLPVR